MCGGDTIRPLQPAWTDLSGTVSSGNSGCKDGFGRGSTVSDNPVARNHLRNPYSFSALPFRNRHTVAFGIGPGSVEQRQGIFGLSRITRMTAVARVTAVSKLIVVSYTTRTGSVTSGASEDAA